MSGFERASAATARQRSADVQRASDFEAALLAMLAHDLRQPLQVVQSTYELLRSRLEDTSEKLQIERGERALAKVAEHLNRLLGALRIYQQTRSINVYRFSLSPLFQRLGAEVQDFALDKGIRLRICPTSAEVMSNPVLLEGILRNLVRNAIKYTDPGGRILVGCRRMGSDVRIDVHDTGIGMAPEHLPWIFEPFQRLDSTRADGLGIGLFVVRRTVELLGHRIQVASAVSRGSRFSVFARAYLPHRH
jgi:two-component system phosphate regulon sensor histidine kinase PhoR